MLLDFNYWLEELRDAEQSREKACGCQATGCRVIYRYQRPEPPPRLESVDGNWVVNRLCFFSTVGILPPSDLSVLA